ncbi:prenyltransferase/squalene oxidase repeat-containing protein [Chitinophaga niabensis]|uniref:Uncharacterized protein n=1 Tax=Chitinophaga niabensis TaxID=536979 RepID=A0A1N6JYF9_9BACT|nr:prenyltransferase/squalene oxidase repeat-containing protein [Chitinophaga niabensis]SIO49374.1 hypothetical protein SAMN04488055_4701 [Chitinophaga niabensis]
MKKQIRIEEINRIVAEAIKNLRLHRRRIKGKVGWHQYLGEGKIGTIATAQALLIFQYYKEEINDRLRIINTLLSSQLKSDDPAKDGGWEYVTNFPGIATVEATCWALLALYEEYRDDPVALAGLNWLLRNINSGDTDEGWGILPGDISRVYTTCLVLKTLKVYGKENTSAYERGLNWLLGIQNLDKGFGSQAGAASNIVNTSRVIITLAANGHDSNAIRSAVEWLKERTRSLQQTKANIEPEYRECIDFRGRKMYFHHMPLQNVLAALILSGSTKCDTVFDGVNSLITDNNYYYWQHPNFKDGKRKPLWAIFDTLVVCKALRETPYSWSALGVINYEGNSMTYTDVARPFSWERFKKRFIFDLWGKIFIGICVLMIAYRVLDKYPALGTTAYFSLIIIPLFIELLGYYLTETIKDKRRIEL